MADPIQTTGSTPTGSQATLNDIVANGNDTMAIIKTTSAVNQAIGFTSAVAASMEMMGSAAKNRADAGKSMV